MSRRIAAALCALGVLGLEPPASAAAPIIGPGHAGAEQYAETLPSAFGAMAPRFPLTADPGRLVALGRGRAGYRGLLAFGVFGAPVLTLAEDTAPSRAAGRAPAGRAAGSAAPVAIADLLGGSDAGGLGVLLPALLLAVSVALAASAVRRLRRRRRGSRARRRRAESA